MFGVGGQQPVLIGLVLLVVSGPAKAAQLARDLGGFAYRVRVSMEEWEYPEYQEKGRRSQRRRNTKKFLKEQGLANLGQDLCQKPTSRGREGTLFRHSCATEVPQLRWLRQLPNA